MAPATHVEAGQRERWAMLDIRMAARRMEQRLCEELIERECEPTGREDDDPGPDL